MKLLLGISIAALACGCAAHSDTGAPGGSGLGDSGGGLDLDSGGGATMDGGLMGVDALPAGDAITGGTSVIYAHTDDTLYQMDPVTKAVTMIGKFSGATGSITDLAVDGEGHVYVNSTTAVYTAALPAGGTGPVALTLKTALPSGSKFYALGFTPAGVLEAKESLIAGDGAGDLYYIDTSGPSSTPVKLGVFGNWMAGDPTPGAPGNVWALSGDVVFYMDGATPRGLATLRTCSTTKTKCAKTNDVLAEIDMVALKMGFDTKSPQNVRKKIIGSGSGTGQLFGLGAWEDKVYAFARGPADLVQMDSTGSGMVLNTFPMITNGWSGAGVTTKAKISVIK